MAFQSMRLTMSRWTLGRQATWPLRRILRRQAGTRSGLVSTRAVLGDECRVHGAEISSAKSDKADGCSSAKAMEDEPSFGRVAACASESGISNRFSVSGFAFVFIVVSCVSVL